MKKLSVVISAFNEEKKIEDCLKSAKFADEIVFVNNSSTDRTREIAEKYTSIIIDQENNPDRIDRQKNTGIEKASNEWTFVLDADEQITVELAKEIKETIAKETKLSGFYVPRKNIAFGKWIEHTGWYPDHQLRLFKKGKGRFLKDYVHQVLDVEGETGVLKNHLLHQNYESIDQFVNRAVNAYTPNEAEKRLAQGYEFSFADAIRLPFNEFLKRFFKEKGYKDGFHGLMLSLFMAFYHFMVFAYIWEKQKFRQTDKSMLRLVKDEFKNMVKETSYWIDTEEIDQHKNPLKKGLLRIKRRLSR